MTTILDDARMVSGHAKKKVVDVVDVKLAVQVCYSLSYAWVVLAARQQVALKVAAGSAQ